ncbi:hypothetical protein PDN30_15985 [Bacillus cereus]|nr:hypothetical protein [Bacillus cereus]
MTDILNFLLLRDRKFKGFQISDETIPSKVDVHNLKAEFSYDGKKASFKLGGKEYWVIDPSRFGGNARLEVNQTGDYIHLDLSNAFYPGTKVPADFICSVISGDTGSVMSFQFQFGDFTFQSQMEPWLVGQETAISQAHFKAQVCEIGTDKKLSFSGAAEMEFFPDWTFHLKGQGIAKIHCQDETIISNFVSVSLPDPGSESLLVLPSDSRTLISFKQNDQMIWSLDFFDRLPTGWLLNHPTYPFDQIHIEIDVNTEGDIRSALLAQPTNSKQKWELKFNGESFTVPLMDMYYVEAFDSNSSQKVLIGNLARESIWCQTDDCSLLLGAGPNTPPFEIVFQNGQIESVVIVPEIMEISAPLKGFITEAKLSGDTNLVAILPDNLNIKPPENVLLEGVIRFSSNYKKPSLHINNLTITVIRPEDLLALRFKFINLSFKNGDSRSPHFERIDDNKPAYLVVLFPPQHIAEQTFCNENEIPNDRPALSRMSGPSRLVFSLPSEVLPYTIDALLDWRTYELSVSPAAMEPNNRDNSVLDKNKPEERYTAIEAPYRLIISPNDSGGWTHSMLPVTSNGFTELWHSRLRARSNNKVDEKNNPLPTIRAIWSPDYPTPLPQDKPFPTSLDGKYRNDIVRQSSVFSQDLDSLPIQVKRLMLSPLGCWMDVHGCWEGEKYELREWQHQSVMGRDQFVKVVTDGYLFPFGHRASLVQISERRVAQNANGENIAYLHKRFFVIVREPEKTFTPEKTDEGRQFPFKSVQILTLVTPDLKLPNCQKPKDNAPFWIQANNQDYLFHLIMTDVENQKIELSIPLAFMGLDADLKQVQDWISTFNKESNVSNENARKMREINGQKVAFGPSKNPGDTTFVTNNLLFGTNDRTKKTDTWDRTIEGVVHKVWKQAPFYPNITGANIRNTAVEQIAGHDKGIDIVLNPFYLDNGFDEHKNIGGILAHLKNPVKLPFPANMSGGLVTPVTNLVAISRELGPIGGGLDPSDPEFINDLIQKATGNFDPKKFLSDEAKILGSIPLNTVICEVKLLNGDSKENLPQLMTRPIYPKKTDGTEDKDAMPIRIETKLLWKPKLKKVPLLEFDGNSTLSIEAIINSRVANPPDSTYEITGELKNFKMSLLTSEPFLIITFNQLAFKAKSGQKTTIVPDIKNIEFKGALEFLKAVQELLKSIGQGPSIEALPTGIRITNTLAIPNLSVGILAIQNMTLFSELNLPFDGQLQFRFNFCTRENPFILTVGIFGGGGFFGITLVPNDIQLLEASLEFGGSLSLNIGVAQGNAHLMAGIYFKMEEEENKPKTCELSGYVRCGGSLEVLGIISISAEFYLGLCYNIKRHKAWGQATLTVQVEVLFFSTSVDLKIEKEFSGTDADPTIVEMLDESQWIEYCSAFA